MVFTSEFECVAKSRMSGDVQVRFCEKLGVKFPRLTRLSQTPAGAHASANLYSLIESAKANGIEPFGYLSLIFKELPKVQDADGYTKLLPHVVKNHFDLKPYQLPQ